MCMKDRVTIAVVGNAPSVHHYSHLIDSCDIVVRFNNPYGYRSLYRGHRVTHLCLVNSGGQVREWLEQPDQLNQDCVTKAQQIVFPVHPQILDKYHPKVFCNNGDHRSHETAAFTDFIAELGQQPVIIPARTYLQVARCDLKLTSSQLTHMYPSSGMLMTRYILEKELKECILADTTALHVIGFTWEGWSGHTWAQEKSWFQKLSQQNDNVYIHPV